MRLNAARIVQRSAPVLSNLSDCSAVNFSLNLLRLFPRYCKEVSRHRMNFICRIRFTKLHNLSSSASITRHFTVGVLNGKMQSKSGMYDWYWLSSSNNLAVLSLLLSFFMAVFVPCAFILIRSFDKALVMFQMTFSLFTREEGFPANRTACIKLRRFQPRFGRHLAACRAFR